MEKKKRQPTLGVGVFILKRNMDADNSLDDMMVLLGRRGPECSRGAGCLALPGGHVDDAEGVPETAKREVFDETGLTVETHPAALGMRYAIPGVLAVTDHLKPKFGGVDHLTFWTLTWLKAGIATAREPKKCPKWQWFTWQMLENEVGLSGWEPKQAGTDHQYHWTPLDLWLKIVGPYFNRPG